MAPESIEMELPLIVIAGPTASGKTSLAIEVAEKVRGEIICADSRTVYKGLDIGAAKPTSEDQARVPHWGLDLVEPGERFTAADFKAYATKKISEIRARGHVPFLVGGTGLYVDAVIFDYQFGGESEPTLRAELEGMTLDELHTYCFKYSIILPENKLNKRYVIRKIEQNTNTTERNVELISNIVVVGIATDRDILRGRIAKRTEQLFKDGVVEEAIILGKKYGWESEAMTGNIYPLAHLYLENKISLLEMKERFTTLDWRLAKRQITWLKRNPYITWLSLTEAKNYLLERLANEHKP